jgi:hypothetical protein
MGIFGTGLARLLKVGGALSQGPLSERLQLPPVRLDRNRGGREEWGGFQWDGLGRRSGSEANGKHGPQRASSRSVA